MATGRSIICFALLLVVLVGAVCGAADTDATPEDTTPSSTLLCGGSNEGPCDGGNVDDVAADGDGGQPELSSSITGGATLQPPPQSRIDYIDAISQLYVEKNLSAAVVLFTRSADAGEPRAYWMLAALHSQGIGVAQSEAQAVLYHTLAAMQGVPESHAALAYRHQYGIGVALDCDKALFHARAVADAVAASYHDDIVPAAKPRKLNDLSYAKSARREGGFGIVSSILGAHKPQSSMVELASQHLTNDELVQFHTYRSETGSGQSSLFLAYAHMLGMHGVRQDGHRALHYIARAAEAKVPAAQGALGQIYLQGMQHADPPIAVDKARAFKAFSDGAALNDPTSLNGLGFMLANGAPGVVDRNMEEAAACFRRAAESGVVEAVYNLGLLHLTGQGGIKQDIGQATALFMRAKASGSPLASWQLANLHRRGVPGVVPAVCSLSLDMYREMMHRGSWARLLVTALHAYERGDYFTSFVDYALAAEIGLPRARWNMAYLVDEGLVSMSAPSTPLEDGSLVEGDATGVITIMRRAPQRARHRHREPTTMPEGWMEAREASRALVLGLMERSAVDDSDYDAHLKVGDAYYYGLGAAVDKLKAKDHYMIAATGGNGQARFNLGLMHQFRDVDEDDDVDGADGHDEHNHEDGEERRTDGVPSTPSGRRLEDVDLHLAKRYYDQALLADPRSFVAVRLALMSLNVQWWVQHFGSSEDHTVQWSYEALAGSVLRGLGRWVVTYGTALVPTQLFTIATQLPFGLALDDFLLFCCCSALVLLLLLRNYVVHR